MQGPPTLLISAAFAVVTAALYAHVGRVILRRHVRGDARLASVLFATFWLGLAAATAIGSLNTVFGWMGVTDLALYSTTTHVVFFTIWLALWALMYYLAYLFTGSRTLLLPISIYYFVFYAFTVYLIVVSRLESVTVDDWSVIPHYANEPTRLAGLAFVVGLVLPPIVGAVAYARLYFRVEGATQRYRIGLVSGTIIAWFGSSLAASVLQVGSSAWWQVASRLIGVVAALLVYYAYRPPAWVRSRWGIEPADEHAS